MADRNAAGNSFSREAAGRDAAYSRGTSLLVADDLGTLAATRRPAARYPSRAKRKLRRLRSSASLDPRLHRDQAVEAFDRIAIRPIYTLDNPSRQRDVSPRVGAREHSIVVVVGLLALVVEFEKAIGDRGRVSIHVWRTASWIEQCLDVRRWVSAARPLELAYPESTGPVGRFRPVGDEE